MGSVANPGPAYGGAFGVGSGRRDQANFKNLSDISKDQLDKYFHEEDLPKKANMSATNLSDLVQLERNKSEDGNVKFGGNTGPRGREAAEPEQAVAGVPFFAGQDGSVQF